MRTPPIWLVALLAGCSTATTRSTESEPAARVQERPATAPSAEDLLERAFDDVQRADAASTEAERGRFKQRAAWTVERLREQHPHADATKTWEDWQAGGRDRPRAEQASADHAVVFAAVQRELDRIAASVVAMGAELKAAQDAAKARRRALLREQQARGR